MRFTTYTKYRGTFLDALNLEALMESGQLTPGMLDELRGEGQGTVDDAARAARSVEFNLTGKGLDFLGYRTLKDLLSALVRSSFGNHETPHPSTGIEAEAASRPYRFGDTLAVVTFGDRAEEIPLAEVVRDPALVRFVSKVSELARGRAYFTTTMTLGQYVMREILRRRTRRMG